MIYTHDFTVRFELDSDKELLANISADSIREYIRDRMEDMDDWDLLGRVSPLENHPHDEDRFDFALHHVWYTIENSDVKQCFECQAECGINATHQFLETISGATKQDIDAIYLVSNGTYTRVSG